MCQKNFGARLYHNCCDDIVCSLQIVNKITPFRYTNSSPLYNFKKVQNYIFRWFSNILTLAAWHTVHVVQELCENLWLVKDSPLKVHCLLFKTDLIVNDFHRNCFWSLALCNHKDIVNPNSLFFFFPGMICRLRPFRLHYVVKEHRNNILINCCFSMKCAAGILGIISILPLDYC